MPKAKFIVLDGPEGCGKSTQAQLLLAHLKSTAQDAILVRDPGTTPIGEQIRALLLNPANVEMNMRCEMLLYMAARAQMMAQVILPALHSGQTVICDRFVSSTLAYQLGGDGLTADDIRKTASIAIRDRWPDLTIILDLPITKPCRASIVRRTASSSEAVTITSRCAKITCHKPPPIQSVIV